MAKDQIDTIDRRNKIVSTDLDLRTIIAKCDRSVSTNVVKSTSRDDIDDISYESKLWVGGATLLQLFPLRSCRSVWETRHFWKVWIKYIE
jgi:hypothetical protein